MFIFFLFFMSLLPTFSYVFFQDNGWNYKLNNVFKSIYVCMGVYFRESVYRNRCIYIFLSMNNVCGLTKVFLCTSFLPYNIQVKLGFIISHFLL